MITQLPDGSSLERSSASGWVISEPAPPAGASSPPRAIVRRKRLDFWQAWNPQDVQKATGGTAGQALEALAGDQPWAADAGRIIAVQAKEPYSA